MYDKEFLVVHFKKYFKKCLIQCLSSICERGKFFLERRKCAVLNWSIPAVLIDTLPLAIDCSSCGS